MSLETTIKDALIAQEEQRQYAELIKPETQKRLREMIIPTVKHMITAVFDDDPKDEATIDELLEPYVSTYLSEENLRTLAKEKARIAYQTPAEAYATAQAQLQQYLSAEKQEGTYRPAHGEKSFFGPNMHDALQAATQLQVQAAEEVQQQVMALAEVARRKGVEYALTPEGMEDATRTRFPTREEFISSTYSFKERGMQLMSKFQNDGSISGEMLSHFRQIIEAASPSSMIPSQAIEDQADKIYGKQA